MHHCSEGSHGCPSPGSYCVCTGDGDPTFHCVTDTGYVCAADKFATEIFFTSTNAGHTYDAEDTCEATSFPGLSTGSVAA